MRGDVRRFLLNYSLRQLTVSLNFPVCFPPRTGMDLLVLFVTVLFGFSGLLGAAWLRIAR